MTAAAICWGDVVACPVAELDRGCRVVLCDTANRYWLIDQLGAGVIRVLVGPVTLDPVLDAAAAVLSGSSTDHHSVTDLINRLAVTVIGLTAAKLEEGAAHG